MQPAPTMQRCCIDSRAKFRPLQAARSARTFAPCSDSSGAQQQQQQQQHHRRRFAPAVRAVSSTPISVPSDISITVSSCNLNHHSGTFALANPSLTRQRAPVHAGPIAPLCHATTLCKHPHAPPSRPRAAAAARRVRPAGVKRLFGHHDVRRADRRGRGAPHAVARGRRRDQPDRHRRGACVWGAGGGGGAVPAVS
jgi:hypothetical protein